MNGYGSYGTSEENQPVMWLRGYPIYAAHFIVVVFTASLLVTTLAQALRWGAFFDYLPFLSSAVLRGEAWRIVSYGFVNPASLWFVVDMFMIVWFGRELEKFFGRRIFLRFYVCLYLLSPIVLTGLGFWRHNELVGQTGAFALFIGFATLYPNVPLIFNVLAKWMAIILVAIFSLMRIGANDWVGLASLWITVGFAYVFVRYEQGHLTLPKFRLRRRSPKLRVLPDLRPEKTAKPLAAKPAKEAATMAEVDALLDKIAQSGMASLTAKERAKLDEARADLIKRGAGRG